MKTLNVSKFLIGMSILVSTSSAVETGTDMFQLDSGSSLGASIGSIGIEAEYTHMISQKYGLSFRLMGGGFSYSGTYEDTDTTYDTDVTLKNLGAVLEYHPLKSGFYVGAGLFYNGNDFQMNAKPNGGIFTFNGVDYPSSLVGSVDGKVEELNTAVPYIGVGYDDSLFDSGNLFFTLKAGAWYQGSPKVSLTAKDCILDSSPIPGTPSCNDLRYDLRQEENDINDNIQDYKWWPVLQIGIVYRF